MQIIRRCIVALVAALIFCLGLALIYYTPVQERGADTYYSPFGSLFIIYLLYAGPVYFIGGVPSSILIDVLIRKLGLAHPVIQYVCGGIAYAVAGVIVMTLFGLFLSGGDSLDILPGWLWIGSTLASLLYYHVLLLSYLIVKPVQVKW